MSATTPAIAELLRRGGFVWREPGYWSLEPIDGLELTLQPQVLNAGAFLLQWFSRGRPLIGTELLVDVKPRPAPSSGA